MVYKKIDNKVYIYGLIDPRNNSVFYIGFTSNLKRRYNSHLNICGKKREKNTFKDNVINKILKLGLKIEMKVLDECEIKFNEIINKYEHEILEIYYIKKYRDDGIRLTNLTDGGEGGSSFKRKVFQYTEDGEFLKEYKSVLAFSECYNINPQGIFRIIDQKGGSAYRGTYLFSSKENAEIFEFKKLLKHKTPIIQYSLDGKFISEYESQADAYRKTNILQSGINCCLRGRCKQFNNFYWYYKDNIPTNIGKHDKYSSMVKAIKQFDLDGKLINEFKSISDASRKLNLNSGHIVTCIQKSIPYGKFIFYYSDNLPDLIVPYVKKINKRKTPVIKYSIQNEYIFEYESIIDASRQNNISCDKIKYHIVESTNNCGGFIWKYKNNNI